MVWNNIAAFFATVWEATGWVAVGSIATFFAACVALRSGVKSLRQTRQIQAENREKARAETALKYAAMLASQIRKQRRDQKPTRSGTYPLDDVSFSYAVMLYALGYTTHQDDLESGERWLDAMHDVMASICADL